jgi:hypothetical protein
MESILRETLQETNLKAVKCRMLDITPFTDILHRAVLSSTMSLLPSTNEDDLAPVPNKLSPSSGLEQSKHNLFRKDDLWL